MLLVTRSYGAPGITTSSKKLLGWRPWRPSLLVTRSYGRELLALLLVARSY